MSTKKMITSETGINVEYPGSELVLTTDAFMFFPTDGNE